jgi:hypothetical protein
MRDPPRKSSDQRPKQTEIGDEYVERLKADRDQFPILNGYVDETFQRLKEHFGQLPEKYARVVDRNSCEPVKHFELLDLVRSDPDKVFFVFQRLEKSDDEEYPDELAQSSGITASFQQDAAPGESEVGPNGGIASNSSSNITTVGSKINFLVRPLFGCMAGLTAMCGSCDDVIPAMNHLSISVGLLLWIRAS